VSKRDGAREREREESARMRARERKRERHGESVCVRRGGLGSRPKKIYGERLGDGVEYHLMSPTPRR